MNNNPTARVHDNKRAFTVTLNRDAVILERDAAGVVSFPTWSPFQVHWLRDISLETRSSVPEIVRGVLVAPYGVTVDDDPHWHGSLVLQILPNGQMGITQVSQERFEITDEGRGHLPMTSCTLPLPKLLSACMKVGAIVGWITPESDTPTVIFDEIGMTPLHPDDVATFTGIRATKDRPGMFSPATLQRCRELVAEHKTTKKDGGEFRGFFAHETPTQRKFVAQHLGYGEKNIQKIITRARHEPGAKQVKTKTTKRKTK
jgi:hypothetical protein